MSTSRIPVEVLRCWHKTRDCRISRITTGLINKTYLLDCGKIRYVLQRLHPVFKARVNDDIKAVTEHLARHGLTTPLIVPTDQDTLYTEHDEQLWRLLSFVPGHSVNAITHNAMAFEAGRVTARFHTALSDFDYEYRSGRGHVHDTTAHLDRLAATVKQHSDHRLADPVSVLARRLLATGNQYQDIDALPLRHCHGDLKISNILFDNEQQAICLIDLDTVNRMAWPLEMGDALRSWCNPQAEDQLAANLDLDILDAALNGYATRMPTWLTITEKNSLIVGLARICLELSVRFLTDTLRENYFAWDNGRYATRGDHNLARANAMCALHDDVIKKRVDAERIVHARLFPQG